METIEVRARIAKIIPAKKDKPGYVVTYPINDPELKESESITFAPEYWRGPDPPEAGQIAFLRGVRKFRGGWRATEARPALLQRIPTRALRG